MSQVAEVLRTEIPLQVANMRRTLSETTFAAGAESDLNSILSVAVTFDNEVMAAKADENLSPKGKVDAAVKAARRALASLDAFTSTTLRGLDARIASVENGIVPTPKPAGDIAERIIAELRAQEIRRQLATLDPLERTVLYLNTTDPQIRSALEEGPMTLYRGRPGDPPQFIDFVDRARVQEQIMARAEQRDPNAAAQLRDLGMLRRVYQSAITTARNEILAVAPDDHSPAPVLVE